jgi:hypothetical protein
MIGYIYSYGLFLVGHSIVTRVLRLQGMMLAFSIVAALCSSIIEAQNRVPHYHALLFNRIQSNLFQRSPEVQNRTRHVYYGEKRGTTENIYFHL